MDHNDDYEVPDHEGHTSHCAEYWERGLDCHCIPDSVKDDIRNGATPDDVM